MENDRRTFEDQRPDLRSSVSATTEKYGTQARGRREIPCKEDRYKESIGNTVRHPFVKGGELDDECDRDQSGKYPGHRPEAAPARMTPKTESQ